MLLLRHVRSLPAPGRGRQAVGLAVFAILALAGSAPAEDAGWPREFESSTGSFVIYQPQPEVLKGDLLTGRAAFSLQKRGDGHPTFGVLWFAERIEVDRDSSTVTARTLDVTKVRLPGITPALESQYEKLVESQAVRWDLSGSLEELQAGLAATAKERASEAGLDNAPPRILFHERRAVLLVYDGAPLLQPIEGSNLQFVANTPCAVVFDPAAGDYYLNGANLWYRARDPLGPWTAIADPPASVREIVPPDTSAYDRVVGAPPEVLTATEPTELIATDGPPEYAPLVDDELLYISNTESDVVREVSTQYLFVLISGRWFRAPTADGPWTFVPGDELPESFHRVPPDSPKGNILASVAGTDQAEDAIADTEIPQTSAIHRGEPDFGVTYDGEPQFEPIEGTNLEFAINTDAEVILADGRYYACDQGVWYIADGPSGPWRVSETRPLGVEDIPPSCPVYPVRFVYVYDFTPDVVYVGYLPGYLGCYPYRGTVVYGTGYRYRSWRSGHHFYPRRFTWGFYARYNPWLSRWSFGVSYGSGFLRVGTRWHPGRPVALRRGRTVWFGPGGYRRPLVARDLTLLRSFRARRARPRMPEQLPANLYNRSENIARVDRSIRRIPVRSIARPVPRPAPAPNDVFAGKDGSVYRRDPKGNWAVREGTRWTLTKLPAPSPRTTPSPGGGLGTGPVTKGTPPPSAKPGSARPSTERPARPSQRPTPPPSRSSPGDLEREYRARQRAESQGSRSAPPPSARPAPPREELRKEKAKEPQAAPREDRSKQSRKSERSR